MSSFVPLLSHLRGYPVQVEYQPSAQSAKEVINPCVVWDLMCGDKLLAILVSRDVNETVYPPGGGTQSNTKPQLRKVRNFFLRFLDTQCIVSVTLDTGCQMNIAERKLTRMKVPPIYDDKLDSWQVLDSAIKKGVEKKISEVGLRDEKEIPFPFEVKKAADKPTDSAPVQAGQVPTPPAPPVDNRPGVPNPPEPMTLGGENRVPSVEAKPADTEPKVEVG